MVRFANASCEIFNEAEKTLKEPPDTAQEAFNNIECAKAQIALLTPNELMNIFPVKKTYSGSRSGTKDYFYTMSALEKHGLDKVFGKAVEDILWDYVNDDLKTLTINSLSVASKLYAAMTGRVIAAEFFFERQGTPIETYTVTKDKKTGAEYITNNNTGQRTKVKPKAPRYMKLKKGGVEA